MIFMCQRIQQFKAQFKFYMQSDSMAVMNTLLYCIMVVMNTASNSILTGCVPSNFMANRQVPKFS